MRINHAIGGIVLVAAAVMANLFVAAGLRAQEPLRWKLETGQKLNYNMVQDMTIGVAGGPLGDQNMTIHQVMNMIWNVVDAKEGGDAVIRQKFDRVQTKMNMPPLGVIEYDSASDQAPVGLAAMLAPVYKALTEAEFELTMTPRGEIKDVKIPEKLIEALKASPNAAALGDLATPDGFKKMMSQSALVLPEKAPQTGEESATKVELSAPFGGKQIVKTTYRYEGTKDVDGVKCAVFLPKLEMDYAGREILKLEGSGTKKSSAFELSGGDAKIRYKYGNDSAANAGQFSVYVVKEGEDFDKVGGMPEIMTQALNEDSQSALHKGKGRYYLNVMATGKWEVTIEETANQPKIKEQESSGEILFNVDAGRLHTSKLDQKMTMDQAAGMQMKINQTIAVEVKPAE